MRELFAEIGLLDRLDAVALSAEVGKRKPHPAIFEAALAQVGVEAGEALMVGDRLREDVAGAQALGMTSRAGDLVPRGTNRVRPSPNGIAATPARSPALRVHNLKIRGLSSLAERGEVVSRSRK